MLVCSSGLLPCLLVQLALVFRVLLHVAVLADTLRILGLVWTAGSAFFATLFEVAVSAHALCIVLLVDMLTLCDGILLADHGLFSLGPLGAASSPLLADQFVVEMHRLARILKVLWA